LPNKISKCHICSKFFDSKKQLRDHIDKNHRITNHKAVTSTEAEKIVDDIFSSTDEGILAISVIDKKVGNILAARSKQSFKQVFGVAQDGEGYGGTLAVATLSVVNELRDIFGEPQTIITIHKDCKLMLLPIPSYGVLIGLALERSVDADDDKIANEIERVVAHTVKPY
jgi:hypothetical protein